MVIASCAESTGLEAGTPVVVSDLGAEQARVKLAHTRQVSAYFIISIIVKLCELVYT